MTIWYFRGAEAVCLAIAALARSVSVIITTPALFREQVIFVIKLQKVLFFFKQICRVFAFCQQNATQKCRKNT